jgi:hypothetical protein
MNPKYFMLRNEEQIEVEDLVVDPDSGTAFVVDGEGRGLAIPAESIVYTIFDGEEMEQVIREARAAVRREHEAPVHPRIEVPGQ